MINSYLLSCEDDTVQSKGGGKRRDFSPTARKLILCEDASFDEKGRRKQGKCVFCSQIHYIFLLKQNFVVERKSLECCKLGRHSTLRDRQNEVVSWISQSFAFHEAVLSAPTTKSWATTLSDSADEDSVKRSVGTQTEINDRLLKDFSVV